MLLGEKSSKTVCFDSFILKQASGIENGHRILRTMLDWELGDLFDVKQKPDYDIAIDFNNPPHIFVTC